MAFNGRRGGYNPYENRKEVESVSYVDVAAYKIRPVLEYAHDSLLAQYQVGSAWKYSDSILFQNNLLTLVCKAPTAGIREYVSLMERKYSINTDYDRVREALQLMNLSSLAVQTALSQWLNTAIDLFIGAISCKVSKYEEFVAHFNAIPIYKLWAFRERFFVIALFCTHEELDVFDDLKILVKFGGNDLMRFYFGKFMESMGKIYGHPEYVYVASSPLSIRPSASMSDRTITATPSLHTQPPKAFSQAKVEVSSPKPIIKPFDVNETSIKQIIDETHESYNQWASSVQARDNILFFNRLLLVLCENSTLDNGTYAAIVNQKYGYTYDSGFVRDSFFKNKLLPAVRNPILPWCNTAADLFVEALQGNKEKYTQLAEHLKSTDPQTGTRHAAQIRLVILKVFTMHPELDVYHDLDSLCAIGGNVYMRNYFDGMLDAICQTYGFPACDYSNSNSQRKSDKPAQRLNQEQALLKIEQLEVKLDRTNQMLKDLQDDFDQQLADSKVTALTDFFAKLNSDRYGNILDMILQLRKGVTRLAKSGYELPEDLNGLFVMYNKLVQFIRDSHIDPIRKPGSQTDVTASDIEFCDYEGTPFTSEEEVKLVETVSPGWVYKDQNVQISRPKVKEIISEAEPVPTDAPAKAEQASTDATIEVDPEYIAVSVTEEEPTPADAAAADEKPASTETSSVETTAAAEIPATEKEPTPADVAVADEEPTPSKTSSEEASVTTEEPVIEKEPTPADVAAADEEPTPTDTPSEETSAPAETPTEKEFAHEEVPVVKEESVSAKAIAPDKANEE